MSPNARRMKGTVAAPTAAIQCSLPVAASIPSPMINPAAARVMIVLARLGLALSQSSLISTMNATVARMAANMMSISGCRLASCYHSLITPHNDAMEAMDNAELERWLEELRVEHRDLDEVIHHLLQSRHHDSMRIQRLKKRKLKLKDMIARLESELIPDLDA